jgi:hypothetical protein
MKLIALLILLSSTVLMAAPKELGVGVMLGNPTGLNGKYWLNNDHAVDGGLGLSLGRKTNVSLHSDFLLHKKEAFYLNDIHPLDFYYGIGGRMEFADDIELGVRVPFGLVHRLTEQNAEFFAEVAPIVDFIYRTGLEVHLLFGARYYF